MSPASASPCPPPALPSRRSVVAGALGACALGALPAGASAAPSPAVAVTPDTETQLRTITTTDTGTRVIATRTDVSSDKKVMAADLFAHPADGRLKIALGVVGVSNHLQIIDAATGELDAALTFTGLSDGAGVRELVYAPGAEAIIATCGTRIIKAGVRDHAWKDLGAVVTDQGKRWAQGYEPRLDSEGMVWIGNHPDAGVVRIDPVGESVTYGSATAGEDATYTRHIAVIADTVYAGVGHAAPRIVAFDRKDPGRITTTIRHPRAASAGFAHYLTALDETRLAVELPLGSPNDGRSLIYDTSSGTWTQTEVYPFNFQYAPHPTRPGHSLAIQGKGDGTGVLFTMDNATGRKVAEITVIPNRYARRMMAVPGRGAVVGIVASTEAGCQYIEVDVEAGGVVAQRDLAVAAAGLISQAPFIPEDENALYVGAYQGRTLTRLDLSGGDLGAAEAQRTPGTQGQVESMATDGSTLCFASYEQARVWRASRPGLGEAALIADLGSHQQSRPFGLALAGGRLCVGTAARSGIRGGSLSLINPADGTATVLTDLVPGQSVVGLVGDGEDTVYATTSIKGGDGDGQGPGHVLAYDARRQRELWRVQVAGENVLNSPLLVEGALYVAVPCGVLVMDPATGGLREYLRLRPDPRRKSSISGYRLSTLSYCAKEGLLVHTGAGKTCAIDPVARTGWLLALRTDWSVVQSSTGRVFVNAPETEVREVALRP
ncbi:PQQ-binding-like beta-propeller repeat protein [Actinomyces bowdenii]|uniref:outer membrane protein assembly factor BamB family protein n=1 Tax=Actinomyces bowdenii TaxID=131109 RepID=UPI001ABCF43C|nr:PQQ-binding-like beta-propeller repeat protein [Actinomyces bowdenii]MBO3723634.1 PQQ-binding-like beta-propeller repeat protein [Actinomyces bowdenii]